MTDEQTTIEQDAAISPSAEAGPEADETLAPDETPGVEATDEPEADAADVAEEQGLVTVDKGGMLTSPMGGMAWTPAQVELVKRTVAKGASDDELKLFMHVSGRTGLDPFAKQIYFIKRWDADAGGMVFQPQTAIDGLRLIAERTGEYDGREGPFWCGDDGVWKDAWLDAEVLPVAAKVVIHRAGRKPTESVALMREYVQKKKDGKPMKMWGVGTGMPVHMIGKVAEALGLRAAFPQELGDVYSFDELPAPADQGEGAVDGEVVAEAEVVEAASVETVDELKAELARLKGRPEWAEGSIVRQAAKVFDRPIEKLGELTEDEARNIIDTAKKVQ